MSGKPIIFYVGAKFTVECAIQKNGVSESSNFIAGLDIRQRAKITAIIKRYADIGIIKDVKKFKKLEGDLWEFKDYQTRVIMYHCVRGVIALTHGFIKKTDKTPKPEIERANRIKAEYNVLRKKVCYD